MPFLGCNKFNLLTIFLNLSLSSAMSMLEYFVPSIGISEIIEMNDSNYLLSSLKDKSIYTFSLKDNQILDFQRFLVGERIRDLIKKNNKIYLFLEDSSSIGILNLLG